MDENEVRWARGHGLKPAGHRLLACCATVNGGGQGEARDCGFVEAAVFGADDDLHLMHLRVAKEGFDASFQDWLPSQESILFGQAFARPDSVAAGDNQRCAFWGCVHASDGRSPTRFVKSSLMLQVRNHTCKALRREIG